MQILTQKELGGPEILHFNRFPDAVPVAAAALGNTFQGARSRSRLCVEMHAPKILTAKIITVVISFTTE